MTDTLNIHHDSRRGRFSAQLDGHDMELDYRLHDQALVFTHTGVAPALQGRGLAAQLVAHALNWAAAQEKQVIPACSYVASYLKRHPQWQVLTLQAAIQTVLNYWFGAVGSSEYGQIRALWFTKRESTDADIQARFGPWVEEALAGGLQDWCPHPLGRLARILLLDQFTRNIYRGQARAFAGDALALQDSLYLLHQGQDLTLSALQRWFALMPLEHAEDRVLQDRSVQEFSKLAALDSRLSGALDYAHKHRKLILRFGRYPHRNAILGRVSTPEEQSYLAQAGAGF